MREGLRLLLESAPDIQVVAEAENGHEAVQRAAKLLPDVVLLDLARSSFQAFINPNLRFLGSLLESKLWFPVAGAVHQDRKKHFRAARLTLIASGYQPSY